MSTISEKLGEIKGRLLAALQRANRPADSAQLLAVSKTFPIADIMEAYNAGQRSFGENRPQELEEKASKMPSDIIWHLIGHLQTNKVRSAVKYAQWIHSVDSAALLARIDRIAGEEDKTINILLEVNISGEESKFGRTPPEVPSVIEIALSCKNIALCGLMTMAPADAAPELLHAVFANLRKLRNEMATRYAIAMPVLSMGMSHDFEIAVEEGSTLVRVGTAIFGKR